VKYFVEESKIIIKYPVFYEKEYAVENLIGYTFFPDGTNNDLILFFNNNKKIKIKIDGKKMVKQIEDFILYIDENINIKNIEELKSDNIEINIRREKIVISIEYIEVIKNNISNKYYYKNDIKNIFFQIYRGTIFTKIITGNNQIIRFSDYLLKGRRGIIKYLEEHCKKCPNCA
jgi:hypothetical protein